MSQVQIQNPSAALAGSQILTKAPTLAQPLSIPSTTSSLPSENAGRPIQNSALPSASVTSTSAAAGQGSAVLPVSAPPCDAFLVACTCKCFTSNISPTTVAWNAFCLLKEVCLRQTEACYPTKF